jgi:hypothetical protein
MMLGWRLTSLTCCSSHKPIAHVGGEDQLFHANDSACRDASERTHRRLGTLAFNDFTRRRRFLHCRRVSVANEGCKVGVAAKDANPGKTAQHSLKRRRATRVIKLLSAKRPSSLTAFQKSSKRSYNLLPAMSH